MEKCKIARRVAPFWCMMLLTFWWSPAFGADDSAIHHHSHWSFREMGLIPVQNGGRIKPLDSFAREVVLYQTGSRRFEGWKPLDLVFSWIASPKFWNQKPFIQVGRVDVRRQLGLDENRTLFSPEELIRNSSLVQYAERMGQGAQVVDPRGGAKGSPREQELNFPAQWDPKLGIHVT